MIAAVNLETEVTCKEVVFTTKMKLNETRFFKMLYFYRKFDTIRTVSLKPSTLKTFKLKTICLQFFFILLSIHIILDPIRHIVALLDLESFHPHVIFLYIYIILYRSFTSLFCLVKHFRGSNAKQLIEIYSKLEIKGEDEKYYNSFLIYSYGRLTILIALSVICNLIMHLILPLLSIDLLMFFTYPVPNHSAYIIPVLIEQLVFNCITFMSVVIDLYVNLTIILTLIYQFNKLSNEARNYMKENQLSNAFLIKKHKDIIEICNTHDTLSSILTLVNESLQMISGYIVFSSITSCSILTYGIINISSGSNKYLYVYVSMIAFGYFLYWIAIFWGGIRINQAVSLSLILFKSYV